MAASDSEDCSDRLNLSPLLRNRPDTRAGLVDCGRPAGKISEVGEQVDCHGHLTISVKPVRQTIFTTELSKT